MKKSVILMAGLMAMALAGSAQAAGNTMFEVQNASAAPQFTATDIGDVEAKGSLTVGGKYWGGKNNIPPGTGALLTAPAGIFHVASVGSDVPSGSFLAQHATTPVTGVYGAASAPSFGFYRINYDGVSTYSLPLADSMLGYFNFGTINTAQVQALQRKNLAQFSLKVEGASTFNPNAWTNGILNNPVYFTWNTTHWTGTANLLDEKMKLTSGGTLVIGASTASPETNKLQVVGLPVFADNAAAAALPVGAFYRTATGQVMVRF